MVAVNTGASTVVSEPVLEEVESHFAVAVKFTEKRVMVGSMPEFARPLPRRDEGWIDLRERLARAARQLHYLAVSDEAVNGAALLVVSGNLARLALSIPVPASSALSAGWVDASTLISVQTSQDRGDAMAISAEK
jgi:hypothetical protein